MQGPRLHAIDIARVSGPCQRIAHEKEALSAAGRVHMAVNGGRRRSGDDEIMAFGLTLYARAYRIHERPIGSGATKRVRPKSTASS